MYLNSENQKIYDFFSQNNLDNYRIAFLDLLDLVKKIEKKELKKILRFVRSGDLKSVKSIFEIIFDREGIILAADTPAKKNDLAAEKKSTYSRVKKYRSRAKQKGLKNISLLVSPDDYQKLKDLKHSKSMTYAEIFSYLLTKV